LHARALVDARLENLPKRGLEPSIGERILADVVQV
jgi:hypothetical protein